MLCLRAIGASQPQVIIASVRAESHCAFSGLDRLVAFFNDKISTIQKVISLSIVRRGIGLRTQLMDHVVDVSTGQHLAGIRLCKSKGRGKEQCEDGSLLHQSVFTLMPSFKSCPKTEASATRSPSCSPLVTSILVMLETAVSTGTRFNSSPSMRKTKRLPFLSW